MTQSYAPSIDVPIEAIAEFCRRWDITEFALFGSVLREDFGPESDVDVLVSYRPGTRISLQRLVAMEDELAELFQRKVDLIDREAVVASPNYIRRREVLRTAQVIYAAG